MMESLNTKTYPGIDALKWVDPRTIAQILKIEHPQTIAVCLGQMEAEQASAVLALLPVHLHADVSLRLATMQEVQPEVLSELSDSLQEILSASMGMSSMSVGGAELMADILTRVDKNTEGAIMAKITERDQALADSIRALMFVFDDLVELGFPRDAGTHERNQQRGSADRACAAPRRRSRTSSSRICPVVRRRC
jgi:flagellar motor switch protein FliG